jgi:hypothetical protein
MKLGFLQWPYDGVNVDTLYSDWNLPLHATKQPANNVFSSNAKGTVISQTTIELWLRRTTTSQRHFTPAWCDINNLDCDAIILPYMWLLYFTNEHLALLSQYNGKIIIDETWDSWIFDEDNNQTQVISTFFKELGTVIDLDNVRILSSAELNTATAYDMFSKVFNNVQIISTNILLLLLSVTIKRAYTDQCIIDNFNHKKDKNFIMCSGRPRGYRLALIKFLTDSKLLDNNFISTNMSSDINDSNQDIILKYIDDIYNDVSRYKLGEFCDISELKNYTQTLTIPEYREEYYSTGDPNPKNNVYSRAKYSLITETLFQTNIDGFTWFTEKTWKPMIYGHPILLFAMPDSWKVLHGYGFESYTQFGAYDAIKQPHTRFKTLCDSIPQLEEELMSKETLTAILHNTNRFYSKDLENSIVKEFVEQIQ